MDSSPGVDLIMADPAWVQARADRLEAIFITHAHEDHVGALGLLFHRLQAPIYARRFTAAIAQMKMERAGQDTAHGAPGPAVAARGARRAVHRRVRAGVALDPGVLEPADRDAGGPGAAHRPTSRSTATPVVGEPFDPDSFRAIGDLGVRALICDSTNVFSTHPGRSEATLAEPITELIREAKGPVTPPRGE